MNNDKILQERWKQVDRKLTAFYNNDKSLNKQMIDRIQEILDGINVKYDNLFNYVDKKYQRMLRSKVNELKRDYKVEGYAGYLLDEYVKKSKLRYNEYLTALFIIEYYKRDIQRNIDELKLFKEISIIVYIDAQKEVINNRPRRKLKNDVPEIFLMELIAMSKYNNAFWKEYKQGNIVYNAEQLFKLVAVNIQAEKPLDVESDDFKSLFDKQQRNYLAKKKDIEETTRYQDEYYGPLDDVMTFIANQIALKGMIDQGCKQVEFIATLDDKTTDMCRSLNGQRFWINKYNKYNRYSAIDDAIIEYTTKGLKTGENLPPIDNSIHHCRSTIYPVRDTQ